MRSHGGTMGVTMRIEIDRRYRAVVVGLLLAIAGAASYYLLAPRPVDPDALWHIASGRYIVQHHAIPATDVFSWYGIEHHLSWMPQAWLFDVLAFATWRLGGFALIYAITAGLTAATVGLVYWLFALRSGRQLFAVGVAALTLAGVMQSISPRPQATTYLLLLLVALLLEHRRWWWVLPIVLLGVNLHGPLYPLFLAVIAYYVLPHRWPVLAASTAVVALNPAGLALIPYPFLSLQDGIASAIREFAPVAPILWPAYMCGLLVLFVLLDRHAVPARDMLALLVVIALSLAALRHMVFLFMLALPLAAPYLRLRLNSVAEKLTPQQHPTHAARVLDVALVAVLGLGALWLGISAATAPFTTFSEYPTEAAHYLRSHQITRYMNEWSDGGYLIFIGMQPMVDGRSEPFFSYPGRPRVTIGDEYVSAFTLRSDIRPLIRRNRVSHVLLKRTSRISRVLEQSASFSLVYSDADYVIYESALATHPR